MSSIFRKQFIFYTGSLVISFVLLGTGLTQAFGSYFVGQRKDMLIEQGEKISKVFEQAYYFGGIYNKDKLNSEIVILDDYLDASFIYLDNSYKILIVSNDISTTWLGQTLDLEEIKTAMDGKIIYFQGNMGGIFKKPVFTVGYPIVVEGHTLGVIFMNSPLTELQQTMRDGYKIILMFMFIAVIIGFILIYISSKKISQPLLEMNKVAKIISNGDFEKRVTIRCTDEIGQLADSLNEMAESLYKQEQRRREFVSNISHDLRSPLTSMRGFLQAIIDGTIPPEKQQHYLNIVLDESERLAVLANNILDINKLEEPGSKLNLVDFDLNELIRKTMSSFESRVLEKSININVTFSEEITIVNADYEKIQRVIYNLVDNAIKFTDLNGEISIITKLKDKKVYVTVKDNGRGISFEDQKRIFDRFYKVDASRGEDKKGSGLGLSIVKEFIKAHGENISLKSEINQGCEFVFTLTKIN